MHQDIFRRMKLEPVINIFRPDLPISQILHEDNLHIERGRFDRNSFLDHLMDKYAEPLPGSVVVCDLSPLPGLSLLGLNCDHTGIYAGSGKIIHRSGEGFIESVSPQKFMERLNGKNFAMTVYISCKGEKSLASKEVYRRARQALHDPAHSGYDLLNKNCHHFTRYCLTGDTDQWGLDFTFTSLQNLLANCFGMDNWRIWDFS